MKLKPTPIAAAAALTLLSAVWSAQAQQADAKPADPKPTEAQPATAKQPATLETVTVTGIRASRQKSIAAKRDADSVVDVITAEDIGKLPDKNIADAVQRLPGVSISKASAGEGGFSGNDREEKLRLRGTQGGDSRRHPAGADSMAFIARAIQATQGGGHPPQGLGPGVDAFQRIARGVATAPLRLAHAFHR